MNEQRFIRDYAALMRCSVAAARAVYILLEALRQQRNGDTPRLETELDSEPVDRLSGAALEWSPTRLFHY